MIIAQIVLGTMLGSGFSGMPATKILNSLGHSLGSVAILLSATFLAAFAAAGMTGHGTHLLTLAFAPGGFAEMSIVALSLGFDVAFVASHHVMRIISMIVLAPAVYRMSGGTFLKPRVQTRSEPEG